MGVKWTTKINEFPVMEQSIEHINGVKIQVGATGEHAWLAGIHEYGCDITPGNAKYLTVPCSPKAKGKSARDFPDLFFFKSDSGEKFLAREVGRDRFEVLFWLTKKVHIPERAFLRTGHDESIEAIMDHAEHVLSLALGGRMSVDLLVDQVGLELSSAIKDKATDMQDSPNSNLTAETKGSNNPLNDTGNMINGITYWVER